MPSTIWPFPHPVMRDGDPISPDGRSHGSAPARAVPPTGAAVAGGVPPTGLPQPDPAGAERAIRRVRLFAAAFVLSGASLLAAAAPVFAQATPGVPPGNPCLKNNGNPCNGNNGNLGRQGNSGHGGGTEPLPMTMPSVSGRGAFIEQVGDGSRATIVQTAPNAYAKVVQKGGPGNEADVTQSGAGSAWASILQSGSTQFARTEQGGSGQNALWVTQAGGVNNWLWSRQVNNAAPFNGAQLTQIGSDNDMVLVQDGSDNRAVLTQNGQGNGMTASQAGDGNRLSWTQQGNYLSDLQIAQTGGGAANGRLIVTQTNQ